MTDESQTFTRVGDLDPTKFAIYAYCGACGHSAPVDPEKVGPDAAGTATVCRVRVSGMLHPDCVHGGWGV